MNAERLLELYGRVSEAPNAIPRLRRFIMDLAVWGKLIEQDPNDEPAPKLLKQLASGQSKLLANGVIRKPRELYADRIQPEPFSIPASWCWVPLERLGAIVGGGTPSASNLENFAGPGEGIPWLTPADLGGYADLFISRGRRDLTESGLKSSSATLMPAGTVLFTSRAPIGYVAIAKNGISTNQGFKSVVPYVGDCSQFIALVLKTFAPEIDANAPGTTFKEVSGKLVAGVPFPLAPLAEQHRIVAKVDELMALCDSLEAERDKREATRDRLTTASLSRLTAPDVDEKQFKANADFAIKVLPELTTRPDQIKVLRQTILDLAVRGKLVEQDPNDEPAEHLLKKILATKRGSEPKVAETAMANDKALPCPNGWAWTCIEALVRPGETLTYGILKPVWVQAGVPTVRVTEMKTGEIQVSQLPHCDPARAAKFSKTTLAPGDLLISKDGTIGKTAFVPPALAGGNITQHVLRFPITDLVDRRYIRHLIDGPFSQNWMVGETKGVALKGVNVRDFRRMPVPIPPLAEQQRIVAKVDELLILCGQVEGKLFTGESFRERLLNSLLEQFQ